MSRLQHLNLSHNRIAHIPDWFGKKLQSLHTLHLQHNLITSLYEVSRLRSLGSLSELSVSGNPACSLHKSRLFLLYHLRTLDRLDNLSITQEERGHAHQCFSADELKDPPQREDDSQLEQSGLELALQTAVTRLHQQEERNQAEEQQQANTLLEQEQLLQKMCDGITQASQHLQQRHWTPPYRTAGELQPLTSRVGQEVDSAAGSADTSKEETIRSTTTSSSSSSSSSSTYYSYSSSLFRQTQTDINADTEESRPLLDANKNDPGGRTCVDDGKLLVSEHHGQTAEQEALRSLFCKLSVLRLLRGAADETRAEMDRLTLESETLLLIDPQPAELTDWTSSSRLVGLDRMSRQKVALEDRLDHILSRISSETQEIKELEQQLTDSQISANEALQRHLEGIICGLQGSLSGLREQARRAQQQVHFLQEENYALKLRLEDTQGHCSQLEATVRAHIQDMAIQQGELRDLRQETRGLRSRLEDSGRLQEGLEAELRELRAELSQASQVEEPLPQQAAESLQARLDQITGDLLIPEEQQVEEVEQQQQQQQLSPQQKLSSSVDRLSRLVQWTSAGRKQLQQDYQCSLEQVDRLTAQLDQGRGLIRELEAQVTRGQDQVTRLKAQLDRSDRQDEQLETLVARQHRSQHGKKLDQQNELNHSSTSCECDRLTANQLWAAAEQLRALNRRTELTLWDSELCEHIPAVEELRVELCQAQRLINTLREELDCSGTRTRTGTTENFRPAEHNAPSVGSQGTHDSGLELHYLGSPERALQQQDRATSGRQHWVSTAPPLNDQAPPAASSHHLLGPALLFCCPPAGGTALHCTVPEHSAAAAAETDRCVCDCDHSEAAKTADDEEEEKKKLKLEAKQLRRRLRQRRQVVLLCDEVECVEKTLLKRRAELRQAERLLLEARSCISSSRLEASSAQQQADLLQHTAERSATSLTEVFRDLQEEAEQLSRRRQREELMLRKVEEALSGRRRDLVRVEADLDSATDRLAAAKSNCQDAQNRLGSLCKQVEQQEQRLAKRAEQEVEEHQAAVGRVKELRLEEQHLRRRVTELAKQQEALQSQRSAAACDLEEDEQKLTSVRSELQTSRTELKQILLELLREQQMLEEATHKRCQCVKQLCRKQRQLDGLRGDVGRAEAELRATQGDVEAERAELEKLREEVEGKLQERQRAELHLKEAELRLKEAESGRKEAELRLEEVELQLKEAESGQKEAELCLKEAEQLKTGLQHQQEELSRTREERSSLEEQCKHLEARRRHAHRCLSAVEAELDKQREELGRVQVQKQDVTKEAADSQEQLQENSELLSLLSERLEEKKKELQSQEQELSAINQQKAEQLQNLDAQIQQKQAECFEWSNIQSAAHQLEDRGRCLGQQEQQLNKLREELLKREEQQQRLREELILKEAWLDHMKEELHKTEDEPQQRNEEESREGAESFYLTTAGRRSLLSTEDERWEVELQRERLRQQEDQLKARLRCSLWRREDTLEERRLEAEETLEGLRHRVDQLDSLLASPDLVM